MLVTVNITIIVIPRGVGRDQAAVEEGDGAEECDEGQGGDPNPEPGVFQEGADVHVDGALLRVAGKH